jgi:hypothetical protein
MNKAEKAFCVLYIVYMLIYMPCFILLMPRHFEEIFPFHILGMFLGLVLIIIVMRDIYKRDFPNPNTKVTWTILIFVTGIAIFPYLFLHGFKPRPNKQQASQNKPQGDDARAVTDGVSLGMENKGKIRRGVPVIAIVAVFCGLIIACVFFGPHLRPERNKSQLEEIGGLQPSDVVSISIVKGEQVFEVPVAAWEIISEAFLASEEVSFIGWRGEHWETFWDLDIQVRNSPVIRLKVETRPSLKGRKIVSLQRLSGSTTHYYGYYDGARLSDVLKEYCPIKK